VFLELATNPFLTNPIDMSIVLVSLVVLKRLASMPPHSLERGSVPVIGSAGAL
jgi:hypothetical protein